MKGGVIGVANIIPGVSGGTLAFLLGIYYRLTEALGNFLTDREKRKSHILFLFLVFLGALVGIIGFARLFSILLERPFTAFPTYGFFGGLILGSVPFLLKAHEDMKPSIPRIGAFILGIVPVLLLVLVRKDGALEPAGPEESINAGYALWLALCGFLGAGSMIVPGFSGSALLVALGEYRNILYFIDERMLLPLLVLAAGIIPGVIIFARVISFLLKRYPGVTFFCILGMVAGSTVHVGKEMALLPSPGTAAVIAGIILFAAGIALSYILSFTAKKESVTEKVD